MYNLFTVLNSAYMPFGKIWIKSLFDNVDQNKIKKIFILDTGLEQKDLNYLESFDKVEIVLSDIDIKQTSNAFTTNSIWLQHVLRKTKFFRKTLKEDNAPLIMIDSDCMFVGDFLEHIDTNYDVQVANRSYHDHDNWIASFFVANNVDNGSKFMNLWISRMRRLMKERPERGWFESHSLNLCLNELKGFNEHDLKVGNVETKFLSCETPELFCEKNTKIVHFKGKHAKADFNERLNRFQDKSILEKIRGYLKED